MYQSIDRYRIEEEIGKGAMANVYRAFDPSINRALAIKVLRADRCINDNHRTRFLRESRTAGNLTHPNIVTIYDVGEDQGQPYIAMELLQGVPLDRLLKSEHHFTLSETLEICMQLAQSLEYAHRQGIVHRDIKPSNIIYSKDSTGIKIKITDFGIAHVEDTDLSQQTQEGDLLGTPQYMSPEQVLGQPVDNRSDLFSFGVILYELLTRNKPFQGDSIATLMFRIATEDPPPMGETAQQIPPTLHRLVYRLLQKKPDKRPADTQELVNILQKIYQDLDKRETDTTTPTLMPVRFKWSAIMAAVITLVAVSGGLLIHQQQQSVSRDQLTSFADTLGNFIATESATHLLEENWAAIDILTGEFTTQSQLAYLTIVDHEGVVRGSSIKGQLNKEHDSDLHMLLPPGADGNKSGIAYINGIDGYHVMKPVVYQDVNIGQLFLALPTKALQEMSNSIVLLLAIYAGIVLLFAVVTTYLLGRSLSYPVHLLNKAMESAREEESRRPIKQSRNDEFGLLFDSFNKLLASLRNKREKP